MKAIETIYNEKTNMGFDCPKCGWEVPIWEQGDVPEELCKKHNIPADETDRYDFGWYLNTEFPDWYVGQMILGPCTNYWVFVCKECKTVFAGLL